MQLEFFDVPSPCIGICQSDTKGFCLGCMRTREERRNWTNLDSDNKQKVIKRCIQRIKRKKNNVQKIEVEEVKEEAVLEQPSLLDFSNKETAAKVSDLDFGDFEL